MMSEQERKIKDEGHQEEDDWESSKVESGKSGKGG
jgi:hypothetical protein